MTQWTWDFCFHLLFLLPLALLSDSHLASWSQRGCQHLQSYILSGPYPTREIFVLVFQEKPKYVTSILSGTYWDYFVARGISIRHQRQIRYSAAAAAKSLQSCPTLYSPIDGSPPGSPIPGILQARILERVAISFFNAWKWKVKVKSESEVTQSCPTPSYPMDCSPPGSSFHGIFQARVLEWGAIAFSLLYLRNKSRMKGKYNSSIGNPSVVTRREMNEWWIAPVTNFNCVWATC